MLIERIAGLIAPHQCLRCGTDGQLLCAWCLPEALAPVPSRCYRCYAATENSMTCKKCRRTSTLGHVWVASEYGGLSKQLIGLLKFERAKAASHTMAALMGNVLPYLPSGVIISHVSTATSRVRIRGYDQAELTAQALSRRLERRHIALLIRRGQSRQIGAKRGERLHQLEGAFSARNGSIASNAHILLVDDVLTTGATLEHAAKALKAAGAKTVDAAVFAQKR